MHGNNTRKLLAKMPCFSFYLLRFFSSIKPENGRVEQVLGGAPVGGGRKWGKGRRMNTVKIMCTCVCNAKMITAETSRNGGG
jgi:hypothetical protein